MSTLWKILTRRKIVDPARSEESSLARVLNTFDLTALGVGSTLGVGMYVLVGKVAKETAGPSVILSFFIAAVASAFAGLCYAEFGARTPRAGSAYIYSYVCVGEFIAFIIGWNLILEYIIGSASVARGMSLYIDALIDNKLKEFFIEIAPINIDYLSTYFDFLSFTIAVVLSIGLAFGMKESSKINNVFTCLNILVVLFVIIAGSTKADSKNWNLTPPANVTDAGNGGFFPFGFSGMIKGAATCFYGFVGFDCIATTGEEVKNPQKAIPFAIILSLGIVFLAYCGTATVVTLMVPYYLQDVSAPIPHAFEDFGWEYAKWIVTIGGIFALCASLFGAMFPLPRILYAMASDGLVFKFLGKVSARFSTPVIGTILAGLFTGIMSGLFEQGQLVDMMSIGTLLAYTIVAACVLLLRYSADQEYTLVRTSSDSSVESYSDSCDPVPVNEERDYSIVNDSTHNQITFSKLVKQCYNEHISEPTKLTEKFVTIGVCIYCVLSLLLGLCALYLKDEILHGRIYAIVITSVIGGLMILLLMAISTQPVSKKELTFKVPLIPLIPATSILINIYLMLSLDVTTWIRFGVWMIIGLPIYFYSAHHYYKDVPIKLNNTNSHNYTNFAFINDEKKNSIQSLDSAYFEESNEMDDSKSIKSLDSTNVLADFDNILDKEDDKNSAYMVLADLDDVLAKNYVDFDRKHSLDTISTISNLAIEENVIAIVHREDAQLPNNNEIIQLNSETINPENIEETINYELENIKETINYEINVSKEMENELMPPAPPPINYELENIKETINYEINVSKEMENEFMPPAPPPMVEFEKFKLPRLSFKDAIKLKAPKIPKVDYDTEKPLDDTIEDELNDDNIEFGSKQHATLKDKLNKIMMKQSIGLMRPNKLTKPPIVEEEEITMRKKSLDHVMNRIISEIPIKHEEKENELVLEENVVIEEEQEKVVDIKSKLNDLFRSDRRNVYTSSPMRKRSLKTTLSNDINIDAHKKAMQNSLKFINKEMDSGNKTFPRTSTESVSDNDDLNNHKHMLENALSSIKLRKNERISILENNN